MLDIAYVGSSSKNLLSQEQINAVPYGAKFLPENQDPTRPPNPTPGDRPHTFLVNFVYQMPRVVDGVLGVLANDWQISGIYRWMSGTPYHGTESARYFVHGPPVNNLELSISKAFPLGKRARLEVRLDAFNALNHTQWSGVNSTVNLASLSDPTVTNLPYDKDGNLVRYNGFGTISGVRPPRTIQLVTRLTF